MTQHESIVSRIRKLQSLTVERGATPEEAANAAAKAQALLFEYNLSQAHVEMPEEKQEAYENTRFTMDRANQRTINWHRNLLHGIARCNFCSAVHWRGKKTIDIVGKPSNVQVVLYLYNSIMAQIERMAEEATKIQRSNKAAFRYAFCLGAVETVRVRLRQQREADERKAATQSMNDPSQNQQAAKNALILHNSDIALKAASEKYHPNARAARRPRMTSLTGHVAGLVAGLAAGGRVALNVGIGSNRTTMKRIH